MLNVNKQQDDIKHKKKKQCDMYKEDEVQEIRAAITSPEKKLVCDILSNICNIYRKSTLRSGEITVAKCKEMYMM